MISADIDCDLMNLTPQFVELDGCSLSTKTLVELGQGKLKIKVHVRCCIERANI